LIEFFFWTFDGPLWTDRVIRHHKDNHYQNDTLKKLQNQMKVNGDTFAASITSYWRMDETAVHMLNKIMEVQTFKTVVSSSWREFCSRETIEYIFELNGLNLTLHDDWCTTIPVSGGMYSSQVSRDRLSLVREWLTKHQDEVMVYAILDDPGSGGSLISPNLVRSVNLNPDNVVIVNPDTGIESDHYLTLFHILTE
jgi:hypothetical protein